tara:strand:+ start:521 stop:778 length:258 start_codon:yes stop_codon:yes gene_type:complete
MGLNFKKAGIGCVLIILTLSLAGCGNCNISKGDNVKRLTDGSIGKVLFMYNTGGATDMCTARILHDGLMGEIIDVYYGADWEVIK